MTEGLMCTTMFGLKEYLPNPAFVPSFRLQGTQMQS